MKNVVATLFTILTLVSFQSLFAQTVYQAEDADVISGGAIESEHTGFTSTGYLNVDNKIGPYVEWAIKMASEGDQTLTIVYAHGKTDDRSMTLNINGTVVKTINFPTTSAWTIYNSLNETVTLSEGLNVVRLTSASSNGGPNLDKIELTNGGTTRYYKISKTIVGEGTITTDPEQDYYHLGSEVTLNAHAADSFFLAGWRGNVNSSDSIVTINIDTVNSMTALFMRYNKLARTTEKIGWMDYNETTTGGEGGTKITVNTQSALTSALNSSDAKIIKIEGSIELTPLGTEIAVGSNTTITGIDETSAIVGGGFKVQNVNNVIIRDLTFKDAYVTWDGKTTDNDALEINNSTRVWVTHCDFSHFDDGLIDIKNASDFVTVSWCRFHNHHKVILIGADDGATQDIGHLNVTLHHNWFDGRFGNGIGERLPLGRFGKIHVFNNYYTDVITRCVQAAFDGNIVVDNNYFLNSEMPHALTGGTAGGNNEMNASGNIYVNSGTRRDKTGGAFDPADYYDYSYHDAKDIPVFVMLGAGVFTDTLLGRIDSVYVVPEQTNSITDINYTTEQLQISAYPQPANDILFIDILTDINNSVSLSLVDLTGRTLIYMSDQKLVHGKNLLQIETGAILPGTYILRIKSGQSTYCKKVIIQ